MIKFKIYVSVSLLCIGAMFMSASFLYAKDKRTLQQMKIDACDSQWAAAGLLCDKVFANDEAGKAECNKENDASWAKCLKDAGVSGYAHPMPSRPPRKVVHPVGTIRKESKLTATPTPKSTPTPTPHKKGK